MKLMTLNVLQTDIERTCIACNTPTRLVVIQVHDNFPMCLDCVFIYEDLSMLVKNDLQKMCDRCNNRPATIFEKSDMLCAECWCEVLMTSTERFLNLKERSD